MPNVECVAMRRENGAGRPGWQLALGRWRHRIDLLHVQSRLPVLAWGACAVTIHDTLFETHPRFFSTPFVRKARLSARLATRRAKLLFTVSEHSRREIARLYGVDPIAITVTSNGVDLTRFHPIFADSGGDHLGAVIGCKRSVSSRGTT